jgi:hypothetical protein
MSSLDLGGIPLLSAQRATEDRRPGEPLNRCPKQGTPVSSHRLKAGGSPQAEVLMKTISTGAFRYYLFPGDHFFIHSHQASVLKAISQEMTQIIEN